MREPLPPIDRERCSAALDTICEALKDLPIDEALYCLLAAVSTVVRSCPDPNARIELAEYIGALLFERAKKGTPLA
jgi:hypothetical protein